MTVIRILIAAPLILGAIYAYAWTLTGIMRMLKVRSWRGRLQAVTILHDGDGGADSPILFEQDLRHG